MNASMRLTTTADQRVILEVGLAEGNAFDPIIAIGLKREHFDAVVSEYLDPPKLTPASLADVSHVAQLDARVTELRRR